MYCNSCQNQDNLGLIKHQMFAGEDFIDYSVQNIISWVLDECLEASEVISYYGRLDTSKITVCDILTELTWIVYAGGFKNSIVRKYWESISEALLGFDVPKVAMLSNDLENSAKYICKKSGFKNLRKAKWCIENARRIEELEQELDGGLRSYFVEISGTTTINIVNTVPIIIDKLKFKGIGETTIFHLLKNMGVDIFKPDIHVCRILNQLGAIDSNSSLLDIAKAMCSLSYKQGIKVSELDTLLFVYGKATGDRIDIAGIKGIS